MSVETAADLAAFFNTEEHAVAALYFVAGGTVSPVTVIHSQGIEGRDYGDVEVMRRVRALLLRAGEVARPRAEDVVEIVSTGVKYRVTRAELDDSGQVWTLQVQGG